MATATDSNGVPRAQECPEQHSRTDAGGRDRPRTPRGDFFMIWHFRTVILRHPSISDRMHASSDFFAGPAAGIVFVQHIITISLLKISTRSKKIKCVKSCQLSIIFSVKRSPITSAIDFFDTKSWFPTGTLKVPVGNRRRQRVRGLSI